MFVADKGKLMKFQDKVGNKIVDLGSVFLIKYTRHTFTSWLVSTQIINFVL